MNVSRDPRREPDSAVVRASHFAVRVQNAASPNDTAHARLHYPAAPSGSDVERLTGILPPDRSGAPLPVVVVVPAVNVGSDTYRWMAVELVRHGCAVVTYDHVGELMPGQVGLSPGIDLSALGPDTFGTRPSATVLGPLLGALGAINADGHLEGMLDLSRVALGGHSAGGTVALENADPAWFGGVSAVFSYGSHTMPVAALGHGDAAVLPVGPVPSMIVAGDEDGVILASADRYGSTPGDTAHSPVSRSFDHGIRDGIAGHEVILAGCNHLLICDPLDPTSARGFLDEQPSTDPVVGRRAFLDLVVAFLGECLDIAAGPSLREVAVASPVVASFRSRGGS